MPITSAASGTVMVRSFDRSNGLAYIVSLQSLCSLLKRATAEDFAAFQKRIFVRRFGLVLRWRIVNPVGDLCPCHSLPIRGVFGAPNGQSVMAPPDTGRGGLSVVMLPGARVVFGTVFVCFWGRESRCRQRDSLCWRACLTAGVGWRNGSGCFPLFPCRPPAIGCLLLLERL